MRKGHSVIMALSLSMIVGGGLAIPLLFVLATLVSYFEAIWPIFVTLFLAAVAFSYCAVFYKLYHFFRREVEDASQA
jgi:hypothetical protein